MKKTLAAAAVLAAFAGSAFAANVTLYGLVDLGLNYQYSKVGDADATNTFKQQSGQNSGSRFGIKATEDLGNGYKVGFILENGFTADDGQMSQSGRLFGRESNLYLTGGFGTLSFGRVGALSAGVGSYNVVYGYTAFGTGWGDKAGAKSQFNLSDRDRFDNTVTYVTPSFAGAKAYLQYSFNRNGPEAAGNERNNDRYAAFGLKYDNGAFSTGLVVDTVLTKSNTPENSEDSLGVSWGASYDFGVAKIVGLAQYGQHEKTMGGFAVKDIVGPKATVVHGEGLEGYALALGVVAPAFGGTFYAQANYFDGEQSGDAVYSTANSTNYYKTADLKRYGAAVGYSYPLSKRTFVYTFGAYNYGKLEITGVKVPTTDETKQKNGEFGFGLVHKF